MSSFHFRSFRCTADNNVIAYALQFKLAFVSISSPAVYHYMCCNYAKDFLQKVLSAELKSIFLSSAGNKFHAVVILQKQTSIVQMIFSDLKDASIKASMVQHGRTRCKTVQHGGTRCNVVEHCATWWNTVERDGTRCNVVKHGSTWCNMVEHIAAWWKTGQHCGTQGSIVEHRAALWNTVQHGGTWYLSIHSDLDPLCCTVIASRFSAFTLSLNTSLSFGQLE